MSLPAADPGTSHIVSRHPTFSLPPTLLCFPSVLASFSSQAFVPLCWKGGYRLNSRLNSTRLVASRKESASSHDFWKIIGMTSTGLTGQVLIPGNQLPVSCAHFIMPHRRPNTELRDWVKASRNKTKYHSLVPRRLNGMLLAKEEGKDVGQVNTTGCKNQR